LRKRAAEISATIVTPENGGDCELHPIETDDRPRAIRAPGSLNPKDGSLGLIVFDSLTDRLHEWRELLGVKVPVANTECLPKAVITLLGQHFVRDSCTRYAIRATDTRHKRLVQLVGYLVNQCGHGLALEAAAQLYKQAQPAAETPLNEHLADFARAWRDFTKKRVAELNRAERRAYQACKSDTMRSALLIMRNWARTSEPDFYAHCTTLASRLEVSVQRAAWIRKQFCARSIIRMTTDYVPHKRARRYQWLLGGKGAKP
jgi:hypothetical protein